MARGLVLDFLLHLYNQFPKEAPRSVVSPDFQP